jgi:PRC-barrel domain
MEIDPKPTIPCNGDVLGYLYAVDRHRRSIALPVVRHMTGGVGTACWMESSAEMMNDGRNRRRNRKGAAMKKGIVVALALSMALSLVAGMASAGVAGSATIGVAVEEMKAVALGWSAKKQILDKDVYNDSNEKVGEVEDLIIAPDKAVSYAIIGVGGFLGIDRHDVAIPAGQLKIQGGKLMLPGATKDALKALPKFEYAK